MSIRKRKRFMYQYQKEKEIYVLVLVIIELIQLNVETVLLASCFSKKRNGIGIFHEIKV